MYTMHSPYASKKRPNSDVSSFCLGFCLVYVFSMWVCVMWVEVRVLWCAWHLLYKNTGVTHQITLCCFILSHLESVGN